MTEAEQLLARIVVESKRQGGGYLVPPSLMGQIDEAVEAIRRRDSERESVYRRRGAIRLDRPKPDPILFPSPRRSQVSLPKESGGSRSPRDQTTGSGDR